MTTFCLPDLGEGLQQAEIVVWHVAAGDHVVADQPLVSVETDKAVVEVPAPQPGRIAKLHGEPGDRLQVGDPLVEFDAHEQADSGTVVGEIATGEIATGEIATGEIAPAERGPAAGRVKATPAVRALARKLDVDLALVQASGRGGSVTAADISEKLVEMNIEVDKKNVLLAEPIKTLGEVIVPIKVGYQMTSEITVQVVPLEAE